jgi:hypothetical protein
MLIMAVGSAALAGCALRDPRDSYAHGVSADGLWHRDFDLIDWNFPTSVNQGPIEAPKRLRLEPTAIGVTWATRNPLPLNEAPAQDAPATVSADESGPAAQTSLPSPVGATASSRERNGAR